VRALKACRGLRAWRAPKQTHGTEEARRVPAALITRAKPEGRAQRQKRRLALRESDRLIVARRKAQAPRLAKGPTGQRSRTGNQPVRTTESDWQTFLRAIAEKAYTHKHHRFGDLYRRLNRDVLRLSFFRLRKDAASGVDGVTFQEYERNLESNLADLEGRLQRKAYRARLCDVIHPQGQWQTAPAGHTGAGGQAAANGGDRKSCVALYEVDFLPCSYGYRPGVSAHDALKALTDELQFGEYHFVVEADIKGFFDNIQWEWLETDAGPKNR